MAGLSSVVELDEAELIPLGIEHDEHNPLVIVMTIARPSSADALDLSARGIGVIDLNIEMQAHLRGLRLRHTLKGQPRLIAGARAQRGSPRIVTMLGGECQFEQRAPERREPCRVRAVDGEPQPAIRHQLIVDRSTGVVAYSRALRGVSGNLPRALVLHVGHDRHHSGFAVIDVVAVGKPLPGIVGVEVHLDGLHGSHENRVLPGAESPLGVSDRERVAM